MKHELIIHGAGGRMGKRIVALAKESGEFDIVGAVDHDSHPELGRDAGIISGIGELNLALESNFPTTADVMIDFSLPQAADKVIDYCKNSGVALVMGTTGLSDSQIEAVKAASATIPVIQATNMSVGMNVLFAMVGKAAKMLGDDYDIEIVEAHHRFKKDSPSGSALTLAERIAEETGREFPGCLVHGREGREALRQERTIGMHAVRAGDIVGQHSVMYGALGETVTISHNAHTRDNFVRGALRAAKWLVGKEPGIYSMADVLGLKDF